MVGKGPLGGEILSAAACKEILGKPEILQEKRFLEGALQNLFVVRNVTLVKQHCQKVLAIEAVA